MRADWPAQIARRFTAGERLALAFEITGSYVRARWWLRRLTLEQAATAARGERLRVSDVSNADQYRMALRLGTAVEKGLDHLPGDTRCLTRSLVLLRLLARRGISAKLVIGVKSEPFGAHAWVEYAQEPVLHPGDYRPGRLTEM